MSGETSGPDSRFTVRRTTLSGPVPPYRRTAVPPFRRTAGDPGPAAHREAYSAIRDLAERLRTALAGRYDVERELGAGGMATVYLAQDRKHDRKVAIKVLRPELSAVIGAGRFLREIKTIANLQHPHILGLIDSGELDGTAYYVMPFVDGESLRDRLHREQQLRSPTPCGSRPRSLARSTTPTATG